MVEKCRTYEIKNIFILELVYTTKIGLPVLEKTEHLCNKLGICNIK